MNKKKYIAGTAVLYAILIVALLSLTVICARFYEYYQDGRTYAENSRISLSYIQTRVGAADGTQIVRTAQDGAVLVLEDVERKVETRIYCADGMLVEETVRSDSSYAPQSAAQLCECSSFSAELVTPQLLHITSEYGSAYAALRGGEATA